MKKLLSLAIGLILVVALSACGGGDGDDESPAGEPASSGTGTFTFASYGGATQDNVNDVFLNPYAEENGIEIVNDGVDFAKLYSMVDSGNVTWDLAEVDGYFAIQACEDGKLEKLSDEVMEAIEAAGLPESAYSDCHVSPWYYSWILAYNGDLDQAPTSWDALLDQDTWPGKRTLWSVDQVGIFEGASLAAGVTADDLYPIDFGRMFGGLDEIKPDIIFTESLVDQVQQVFTGQATMGILAASRALDAKNAGEPIEILWDQQILSGDPYVVPKGAPNAQQAMEVLVEMLDTNKLVEFAQANGYGPSGSVGQEALAEAVPNCEEITTCPQYLESSFELSDQWWQENREEATERWEEWVGA